MPVTFPTANTLPGQVRLKGPAASSTHYLSTSSAYREAGCGTVVRETPWAPATTFGVNNGFVHTVVEAYNRHHNLVIRPDDIWLAVAVQFGFYVNGNSEALRDHFVTHDSKKELTVRAMGTLFTTDYGDLITRMANEQLRQSVKDPLLVDWITPDFTTTTDNDRLVGSVVLMATMQNYFDYKFQLDCGIPEVTLLGTVEDWEQVLARVEKLAEFDVKGQTEARCAQWAGMLKAIVEQCVAAAKGNAAHAPDNFWQRICHYKSTGSGPVYLSGWISAFCVFDQEGQWQADKHAVYDGPHLLGYSLTTWNKVVVEDCDYPVIDTNDIPRGYLTVPVKIDDNGEVHDTLLFAGHTAYTALDDVTVQPMLTWHLFLKDGTPNNDIF